MALASKAWGIKKVEEVASYITVGFVGSMASLFVEDGVPLLRGQNIRPYALDLTNLKYISPATHKKWKKSALFPGDVVIVRVGYPGTACVIPEGVGDLNAASLVIVRPDPLKLDSQYLCYVLNSPWGKARIQGSLVGAAQQVFNTHTAASLEIPTPPLPEQKRIAEILSAYDELIENCQKRIKVLETMARNLYREWFVHFRYPGHENTPLIPSSLGDIPKGWEVRNLKDVATVTYGFPFKSKEFNADGNGTPVIRIRDIPQGCSATFTKEDSDPKFHIRNGHILIGMDGDFHMCIWSNGHAFQNQRVARFESKGEISNYHLFLALGKPIQDFNKAIVGTTVAHLGDMHIKTIQIVWPPEAILQKAAGVLEPLSEEIITLKRQIQNLRKTRDLLLPRLLSGQIPLHTPTAEVA